RGQTLFQAVGRVFGDDGVPHASLIPLFRVFGNDVFADHQALADDEGEHQNHGAEQLEVHPGFSSEVVGDDEVEATEEDEEGGPGMVELVPDRVRHADLLLHHAANQVLFEQQAGD